MRKAKGKLVRLEQENLENNTRRYVCRIYIVRNLIILGIYINFRF